MRNRLLSMLIILGIFLVPSALAANSQGLVWGVTENQEIKYTFHIDFNIKEPVTSTMVTTDVIVFKVLSLPTIPDTVESTSQIPFPNGKMTYENGTAVGALPFTTFVAFKIHPVGNWGLIDSIYKESAESSSLDWPITWTNDLSNWGYSFTTDEVYETTVTALWSKSDGAPSLISVSVDMGDTGSEAVSITRIGGLDTTTLIIVGIGVVGAAIVVIVILKRR